MAALSEQNQPDGEWHSNTLNGSLNSARGPELTVTDERVKLIERLIQEAIEEPSPVAANLKANGGDLLEMALFLKPQITAAMKSCANMEDLRDLRPLLDTYVKLGRQADRFLRLGQEIAQADSNGVQSKRLR